MKLSKAGMKKRSPNGLTIARAYRPVESLRPEAVDELSNKSTPITHPLPHGGGNINKHNMVIFHKKRKEHNEIQLTKKKWTRRKMKHHTGKARAQAYLSAGRYSPR